MWCRHLKIQISIRSVAYRKVVFMLHKPRRIKKKSYQQTTTATHCLCFRDFLFCRTFFLFCLRFRLLFAFLSRSLARSRRKHTMFARKKFYIIIWWEIINILTSHGEPSKESEKGAQQIGGESRAKVGDEDESSFYGNLSVWSSASSQFSCSTQFKGRESNFRFMNQL